MKYRVIDDQLDDLEKASHGESKLFMSSSYIAFLCCSGPMQHLDARNPGSLLALALGGRLRLEPSGGASLTASKQLFACLAEIFLPKRALKNFTNTFKHAK